MTTTDPYSAPQSAVGQVGDETYQPKFLSLSGRIGRLRYLAYGAGLNFIYYGAIMAVAMVAGLIFAVTSGAEGEPPPVLVTLLLIVIFVGLIPIAVFGWGYMVRRLNDIDQSGWLSLLAFVPLANIVLMVMLIFVPGTKTTNRYGARPNPNTAGIVVLALGFPVLIILIGIVAAVALPAYQDYALRAAEMGSY